MKTTTRRKQSGTGPIWALALLVAVGLAIALAAYQDQPVRKTHTIEIGDPISVTPTGQSYHATSSRRSLVRI